MIIFAGDHYFSYCFMKSSILSLYLHITQSSLNFLFYGFSTKEILKLARRSGTLHEHKLCSHVN
jgi:hypothetical protein